MKAAITCYRRGLDKYYIDLLYTLLENPQDLNPYHYLSPTPG